MKTPPSDNEPISAGQYQEMVQKGLKKPGKYHNNPVVRQGIRYDSEAEYRYKGILDMKRTAGLILGYTYHIQLPLIAGNGVVLGYYEADFMVDYPDGRREFQDIKVPHLATSLFRWKARHVQAQYGDPVIIIDSKTFQPVTPKTKKP